jgi:hypothetical protein
MRKRASKRNREIAQPDLFSAQDATPAIPPEVQREVRAALVELLLEAAAASRSEVKDER